MQPSWPASITGISACGSRDGSDLFAHPRPAVKRGPRRSRPSTARERACTCRTIPGVPDDVRCQTKPEIASQQLRQAVADGVTPGVALVDPAYGNNSKLRAGISELALACVAGILPTTMVWRPGEAPLPPASRAGRSRPGTRLRRDKTHRPVSAKALAADAWQPIKRRDGSNTPLTSRFARWRVRRHRQAHRYPRFRGAGFDSCPACPVGRNTAAPPRPSGCRSSGQAQGQALIGVAPPFAPAQSLPPTVRRYSGPRPKAARHSSPRTVGPVRHGPGPMPGRSHTLEIALACRSIVKIHTFSLRLESPLLPNCNRVAASGNCRIAAAICDSGGLVSGGE